MRPPPADTEAAYRELFEAAYDDLLCFVERRLHPAVADDVVAEVFLTAWRRFDDVPRPLDEARAWLFTTAHNMLRNRLRSDQRQQNLTLRILREPEHPGRLEADAVAARVDLRRAWDRLPGKDQEALTLTVFEGLTGAQAARLLNISRPAFSLRLLRARRRLQHLLRPRSEPDTAVADPAPPARSAALADSTPPARSAGPTPSTRPTTAGASA
ncbi:sigma-70 family RNA polymerase sigma factor [Actinoplanes oblitus]|uniref:Sigma-70 family RNA polymerase sigma factor n=1 Tax=Actinoplanes oblitus TaxID=3040509 RepID=A0ABY8W6R1_9ACTN|nr:sigma-70 family RNA polymerase sigma factor [Actinoplanes oblitus]WIM93505.1 sigma-70 family RNA polymerase sigma factor [Actinoplanes oblitus]